MIGLIFSILLTISPTIESQQPQYEFYSTSQMLPTNDQRAYAEPFADYQSPQRSRRAIIDDDDGPGYDPNHPGQPLGEGIGILLFLAIAYVVYFNHRLKNR